MTLGRDPGGFSPDHPALVAMATEPSLHGLKLVAEPWDVGPGGWRTGQFPVPFAEWNDRFRNAARSFWLADPGRAAHGLPGHRVRDLATRLSGSVDLFGHSDPPLVRGPGASVNYVTAHDGFTLADLVAYDHKHNAANGEQNRDGSDDNRSWNHGIEGHVGPDSPAVDIVPLRRRSIRNLFATLVLAAGTPMITAGDEMGRTQHGQQQRLLPGQRDLLGALGPDARGARTCSRPRAGCCCCAASTPRCAPSGSTPAGPYVPGQPPGPRLVRRARRRRSTTTAGTTRRSARSRWCAPRRRPSRTRCCWSSTARSTRCT